MESKLIREIRLELQKNRLLQQIEYQLENPMECTHRYSFMCKQCIYNIGTLSPICANTQ